MLCNANWAKQRLIISAILLIVPARLLSARLPIQTNTNNDTTSFQALRLTAEQADEIRLDGILAEACWQAAQVVTGFRQREPAEGAPASERTEVRLVYDQNTLYIGVMAYDTNPDKIISRILQRDKVMFKGPFDGKPYFGGDDAIAILLDPFHDHRNAVVFATNPNGAEFEALISDEGQDINIDWRAIWRVEAKRIPQGWSAEFAIPFRTLRYPSTASDAPWGFNIYRVIRHKNEEVLWRAWSRDNEGFARVSKAGHIYGMHDLPRPGLNLELKPYTLTGGTQEVDDFSRKISDGKLESGLDAKWEVRPGLLLDLTLKTDFAQVEVDDEQVNLTRFSLFFPEKRDFFLENAGIFDYGFRGFGEPPPFLLFFSRQIGISEGEEIPVLAGARLTGRVGRQTIGLLNIATNDFQNDDVDEPNTNFAVARIKRDIGDNNYIGLMATDRRSKRKSNSGAGIDWTFLPSSKMTVRGFAARTFTSGLGGEDNAYQFSLDYTSDKWGYFGQYLMVGSEANAEMGFITRKDIRRMDHFFRVSPRPDVLGLRVVNIFFGGQRLTRVDGEIQDWNFAPSTTFEWNSGENLTVFYSSGFTRLNEGFDLAGNIEVRKGDYDLQTYGMFFNTSRNRSITLSANAFFNKIYDGTFSTYSGSLFFAPGAHLTLRFSYINNRVDLPDGAFNADIGSLRLSYAFNTRLFVNALVQYNRLDNTLSTNFRLNYIHSPGSDIFLVINDNRGKEGESLWDLDNRGAILKVTYLRRL